MTVFLAWGRPRASCDLGPSGLGKVGHYKSNNICFSLYLLFHSQDIKVKSAQPKEILSQTLYCAA
jgi:hypothetical protein